LFTVLLKMDLINQTPTLRNYPFKDGLDESSPYNNYTIKGGFDESNPYKSIRFSRLNMVH